MILLLLFCSLRRYFSLFFTKKLHITYLSLFRFLCPSDSHDIISHDGYSQFVSFSSQLSDYIHYHLRKEWASSTLLSSLILFCCQHKQRAEFKTTNPTCLERYERTRHMSCYVQFSDILKIIRHNVVTFFRSLF